MKKVRSAVGLLALTLFCSVILCGCGDDKNTGSQASNGNVSSSEPTYGGSVVVGIQQDLDSLDPHKAVAAGTKELLFNVYEGLVKPDPTGDYKPAVASDYTVDDTEYTFTLREGITFHNGNPVTTEDIKYSIDRCAGLLDGSGKDYPEGSGHGTAAVFERGDHPEGFRGGSFVLRDRPVRGG